jgi:alkylation response protein AidB-like acyl-CoA dehydrogenase
MGVLRDLPLGGLDLPERLGGVAGGVAAKCVVLEALAMGDAGGLPAADQPGPSAGALVACPDAGLAGELSAACLAGDAPCALVVAGGEGTSRLEWAPSQPAPLWAFVSVGSHLRLLDLGAVDAEPVVALAFQASGGVSVDLSRAELRSEWDLGADAALAVRGRARLWAAAVAVGVAQSAFDATVAYTTERIVFGKAVAHHQGNAFDLAVAATEIHGARLAVADAAARLDAGEPLAGFWATQAWLVAIDAAVHITDLGVQLLGGHGFLVDHPAEKRFREARMLGLLAGGRDAADDDLAATVLDVPDPLFA